MMNGIKLALLFVCLVCIRAEKKVTYINLKFINIFKKQDLCADIVF